MKSALLLFMAIAMLAGPACADEFESNGVRIHYTVTGHGQPVVLVHGLYSSAMMNWQLPGIIQQLSKHDQVIAFDNRGHGQSDKPQSEDAYGEQMCEDVVRLLDHLHIKKASVVGYSLGGFIVLKLVVLHPERVNRAVMCGAAWLQSGSMLDRFWANMRPRSRQAVPEACLRGVSKLSATPDEIKSIKVPVTLIVGDRDPCRAMYIQPLSNLRPDWPLYTVKGAGHINCIVKPEFKNKLEAALAQP